MKKKLISKRCSPLKDNSSSNIKIYKKSEKYAVSDDSFKPIYKNGLILFSILEGF